MGMIIDPYRFAVAGGGIPDYWTDVGLAELSDSFAVSTQQASVTIPAAEQTPSTDYLAMWSMQAQTRAANAVYATISVNGVRGNNFQHVSRQDASGAWNYPCFGGFRVFQSAATPADITVAAEHSSNNGTHYGKNARVTVLQMGSGDLYAQSLTAQQTFSTTFVEFLNLELPVGDFIVFVSSRVWRSLDGVNAIAEVIDDGGTLTTGSFGRDSSFERVPLLFARRITVSSGTNTIRIRLRTTNASFAANISDMCIVAIDASRFSAINEANLLADNSGTQTTDTSFLTQTFTPPAGDALVFATGLAYTSSALYSRTISFTDDGSSVLVNNVETAEGTLMHPFTYHDIRALAGTSMTQTLFRKIENSAATALVRGATILTLSF